MSQALPASIFREHSAQEPFLFRKRFSLKEVEKECRLIDRVIVSSNSSSDASFFKELILLIILVLLDEIGRAHV